MSTLTVRLPDETALRIKLLAQMRGMSVNKLIEQMSTQMITAWDTEMRFRTLASSGNTDKALAILDRLDGIENSSARRPK